MIYLFLVVVVIIEVIVIMLFKMLNGWEKWVFGYGVIFFYVIFGMLFVMVLKNMGIGVVYVIWLGMGIVFIIVVLVVFWK